jgi:hypothetical protein
MQWGAAVASTSLEGTIHFTEPQSTEPPPNRPPTANRHPQSPTATLPPQILYTVREDLDNPWTVISRNALHEQKLRDWRGMGPEDKVLSKMADILQQVR